MGVIRNFGGVVIKGIVGKLPPTKEQNHQEVDVLIVQDRGLLTMIFGSNS